MCRMPPVVDPLSRKPFWQHFYNIILVNYDGLLYFFMIRTHPDTLRWKSEQSARYLKILRNPLCQNPDLSKAIQIQIRTHLASPYNRWSHFPIDKVHVDEICANLAIPSRSHGARAINVLSRAQIAMKNRRFWERLVVVSRVNLGWFEGVGLYGHATPYIGRIALRIAPELAFVLATRFDLQCSKHAG